MYEDKRGVYIGVDIGGNKLLPVVSDGSRILNRFVEFPTRKQDGPEAILSDCIEAATHALQSCGLSWDDVAGFGLTVPAPVYKGVVLDVANLDDPRWRGFNMEQAARTSLASRGYHSVKRFKVLNDAAAALKGSAHFLGANAFEGCVFGLYIGTGIGAAYMFNGVLLEREGGGSEPGHSYLWFDDRSRFRLQVIPEHRQFEHVGSLGGIIRLIPHLAENQEIPPGHPILLSPKPGEKESDLWCRRAKEVLKVASQSIAEGRMDDIAVRIMEAQAEVIGQFLALQVLILRPHTIFLGGGVTEENKTSPEFRAWFLESVLQSVRSNIPLGSHKTGFQIIAPLIGDQAAAFGAALSVSEGQ